LTGYYLLRTIIELADVRRWATFSYRVLYENNSRGKMWRFIQQPRYEFTASF